MGGTSARIRAAAVSDMQGLRRLYDEFHAFHVRGVPDRLLVPAEPVDDGRFEALIHGVLTAPDAMLLVAEAGGELLGLAEMYVREDEASPYRPARRYGHLQSLAVTEASRGNGIGTLLLEAAERWAVERGALECRADVWEFEAGPLPFYERAGYRTLRRTLIRRRPLG